jgi:cytoskeletal protein RodZ
MREHKGLSLQQIAEKTKISMRFLIAIENEEFSKLPGGIFDTSYLRQYASAIGFEESKLLARYRQKSRCDEYHPAPPKRSLAHWLRWLSALW